MSNAHKFLEIFNKIERHLIEITHLDSHTTFIKALKIASEKFRIVRNYQFDLQEIAILRNVIVHQSKEINNPIAEPNDKVVAEIKNIYEELKNPPTAYSIAVKEVTTCTLDESIINVMNTMKRNVFTHLPIYEKESFVGIFSESSLLRWLYDCADQQGFLSDNTKISDLKEYFDQPDDSFNYYKFVSRNMDAYKIRDNFLISVEQQRRLGLILVTQSGKKEEKLLGIITAWDLPKIKRIYV